MPRDCDNKGTLFHTSAVLAPNYDECLLKPRQVHFTRTFALVFTLVLRANLFVVRDIAERTKLNHIKEKNSWSPGPSRKNGYRKRIQQIGI